MSWQATAVVKKEFKGPAALKLLAMCVADYADPEGRSIRPSIARLASDVGASPRTVTRQMAKLRQIGFLIPVSKGLGGSCKRGSRIEGMATEYVLNLEWYHDKLSGHPTLTNSPKYPDTAVSDEYSMEESINTPLPPEGGDEDGVSHANNEASEPDVKRSPVGRVRKPLVSLKAWLAQCREQGVKPVPEGDPLFAYCAEVGISEDILALHWWLFKRRRSEAGKMQRDWPMTLRNSVEGNWYRLWFIKPGQAAELSTQGLQAQAARAAEERMAQAGVAEMVCTAANEPAQHRMERAA
jgi:DNA-binding Lrp family transcriptional regulator